MSKSKGCEGCKCNKCLNIGKCDFHSCSECGEELDEVIVCPCYFNYDDIK